MQSQLVQQRDVLNLRAFGKIRDVKYHKVPGVSVLIIVFFLKQTPKWLATIEEGFITGHRWSVALAAHSLKAVAGTVGAFLLYDAACQIIPVMEKGSLADVENLLDNLATEWAAARQQLGEERQS